MLCDEFRAKYNLTQPCCGSCHSDDESASEVELPNGETAFTCCVLANEYREKAGQKPFRIEDMPIVKLKGEQEE